MNTTNEINGYTVVQLGRCVKANAWSDTQTWWNKRVHMDFDVIDKGDT